MTHVRLATRGSPLALSQARLAAEALRVREPSLTVELVRVRTEGDGDRLTPLRVLGGRGVFVRGVERALREDRADMAAHSLKDVPSEPAAGLTLAAILPRGDARDALVAGGGRRLAELGPGARVGTGSQRRRLLLGALRPDLRLVDVRGNVDTRLRMVGDGALDAVVLAAAGLERLGRLGAATELFAAHEFLPSPGQGAIALQCRAGDRPILARLSGLDDAPTRAAVEAERGFLAAFGSGCSLPIGAYGQVEDGLLKLRAMVCLGESPDGGDIDSAEVHRGDAAGPPEDATTLGRGLAAQLSGERLVVAGLR